MKSNEVRSVKEANVLTGPNINRRAQLWRSKQNMISFIRSYKLQSSF